MKASRCLFVGCLAMLLTACTSNTTKPPVTPPSFGSAGRVSGSAPEGVYAISVTQHQVGDHLTYFVLGQLPGEDPAPVALVLLRTPAPDVEAITQAETQDGRTSWTKQLSLADGKKFDLVYAFTHKPVRETFTLGGQPYDFDSGCVFLIDLREQPVKPVQIKTPIVPLLPSRDPTQRELLDAVEKLKAEQERVRKFLSHD